MKMYIVESEIYTIESDSVIINKINSNNYLVKYYLVK